MGAVGLRQNDRLAKNTFSPTISGEQQTRDYVRKQKEQQAIVLDKNGNPVQGFIGGKKGVYVTSDMMQVDGGTLIYGHIGKYKEGGTFSPSALTQFAESKLAKIQVTGHGKNDTYEFAASPNANRTAAAAYLKRIGRIFKGGVTKSGKLYGNYRNSYETRLNRYVSQGMNKKTAAKLARSESVEAYSRAYKKMVDTHPEWGFTYKKLSK